MNKQQRKEQHIADFTVMFVVVLVALIGILS